MNYDVLICYHNHDREIAEEICLDLAKDGIEPRHFPLGSDYSSVIKNAINSCKVVVVIFSEAAATSQWLEAELNTAIIENKPIILYRLDLTPFEKQDQWRHILSRAIIVDSRHGTQALLNAINAKIIRPTAVRPIISFGDMISAVFKDNLKIKSIFFVLLLIFIALVLVFIFLLWCFC